jgi:hypothetical protein
MTKKQFSEKCKEMEAAGWRIVELLPHAKKAIYHRNNIQARVGK